jgi:hypothetical protein
MRVVGESFATKKDHFLCEQARLFSPDGSLKYPSVMQYTLLPVV